MVYTGIFATLLEVQYKAGANANATATADTMVNSFIAQAEGLINSVCRYNYSDNYAGLDADVKTILTEVASNLAAIYCIMYDMSGFTSRTEAEDMINVLRDGALRGISLLRDKKVQTFINEA